MSISNERSACLLKLTAGTQAQARQESWKKRPVGDRPPDEWRRGTRGSEKVLEILRPATCSQERILI